MVNTTDVDEEAASGQWLEKLLAPLPAGDRDAIVRAEKRAEQAYAGRTHPTGRPWLEHARGAAEIVATLRVGGDAIAATLLLGDPLIDDAPRAEIGAGVAVI